MNLPEASRCLTVCCALCIAIAACGGQAVWAAEVRAADVPPHTGTSAVTSAGTKVMRFSGTRFAEAPVDGWLLPAPPAEMIAKGDFEQRQVIFGTNAQEVLMYLGEATEADWREALGEVPDSTAVETMLDGRPLRERLDALQSALQFHCPSIALADGFAAAGFPTFVYRFDRVRAGEHGIGAYHGAEIPYIFGTHDNRLPTGAADASLTRHMMSYWLNFAASGDPNHDGAPKWPRWTVGGKALILDTEIRAAPLDAALCSLLEGG